MINMLLTGVPLSTAHCPQANQEVPDLYLFLYLLQLLYCFVN